MQIRAHIDGADLLPIVENRHHDIQIACAKNGGLPAGSQDLRQLPTELLTGGALPGQILAGAQVEGQRAFPLEDHRQNHRRLALQRLQRFLCRPQVIEIDRQSGAGGDDAGQRDRLPDQIAAEMLGFGIDQRNGGEKKHRKAGDHDDDGQFALDGKVFEKIHFKDGDKGSLTNCIGSCGRRI